MLGLILHIRKMITSSLMGFSKDRISVDCSINLSEQVSITPSVASTEMARVQAKLEFDLEVQKIKYYIVHMVWLLTGVCYITDSAGLKLRVDNYLLKEGSRTKLFRSLNIIFLIKLFYVLISLCFSTLGAEDFRTIIEERWEKFRSKPSNPEQA